MHHQYPASLTFTATWFNKFFECFVTYVFLRDLAYIYLPLDLSIFNTLGRYFETLFTGWNLLAVIAVIVFSFWWNREEEREKFNSPALHSWLRLIMSYYAAYLIFQYGLAKVYNNQFLHIYYRDDSLAGHLTGFAVAWNFFSYSYYFTLLIGILQITGGILLLFIKTRLAGAALLLPLMINILFINIFYGVSTDAFVNAILITVSISYILWLQRKKLLALFFSERPGILSKKIQYTKATLRVIVIVFAFTAGYPYNLPVDIAFYAGKWKIAQLMRNGKIIDQQQWQNNPGIWNNVYIEIKNKLAFSANPNYYDYSKNRILRYQYQLAGDHLFLSRYPSMTDIADTAKKRAVDSATVSIRRYNANNMQWNAIINGDTLQMQLSRDTLKNVANAGGDLR